MTTRHPSPGARTIGLCTLLLAAAAGLGGCSNMNDTQQRLLSGAALGTAGGAVIGAATGGSILVGGVVGGALGAAGGYVVDQVEKHKAH